MSQTLHRGYPLPDPDQPQRTELARISAAISASDADIAGLLADLAAVSASLTGLAADMSAQILAAIADLRDGAPAAYDTLREIAAKLADGDDAAAAMLTAINDKASSAALNALAITVANGNTALTTAIASERTAREAIMWAPWAITTAMSATLGVRQPETVNTADGLAHTRLLPALPTVVMACRVMRIGAGNLVLDAGGGVFRTRLGEIPRFNVNVEGAAIELARDATNTAWIVG